VVTAENGLNKKTSFLLECSSLVAYCNPYLFLNYFHTLLKAYISLFAKPGMFEEAATVHPAGAEFPTFMLGADGTYIDLVCQRLEALNHTWTVDQIDYIPSDAELVKLYRKAHGKNPKLKQYAVIVNKSYYEQDAQGRVI